MPFAKAGAGPQVPDMVSPRTKNAHPDIRAAAARRVDLSARRLGDWIGGPPSPKFVAAISDSIRLEEQIMRAIDDRWPNDRKRAITVILRGRRKKGIESYEYRAAGDWCIQHFR